MAVLSASSAAAVLAGSRLSRHFAADAMQLRFERAMSDPLARQQRFVEDGDGAFDIAGKGFGFSESDLNKPIEDQWVLFAQEFDAATHGVAPAAGWAAFGVRQPLKKDPERSPNRQIVLAARGGRVRRRSAQRARGRRASVSNMAALQFPYARVPTWARLAARAAASRLRETARSTSPSGHRVSARKIMAATPSVLPEAEGKIVVAPGLKQGERAFQMRSGFASTLQRTNAWSRLRGGRRRPRANWVSASTSPRKAGAGPHRRKLAPDQAAHP